MPWSVLYSAEAEQDLNDLYDYIAYTLLSPDNAASQLRRIMTAVEGLEHMPTRHPVYPVEPWQSAGLRFMPIDHYIVFYLVSQRTSSVSIVRIAYGARSIERLLGGDK